MTIKIQILFLLLISMSCKRQLESCVERNVSADGIHGQWKQSAYIRDPNLNYYEIPSRHEFTFWQDSFRMRESIMIDFDLCCDSCRNTDSTEGMFLRYATGTYTVTNNSLVLKGLYTWKDYQTPFRGCKEPDSTFTLESPAYYCGDTLILPTLNKRWRGDDARVKLYRK